MDLRDRLPSLDPDEAEDQAVSWLLSLEGDRMPRPDVTRRYRSDSAPGALGRNELLEAIRERFPSAEYLGHAGTWMLISP